MPFGDVDTAASYLMRRLEMARAATQLPASAQFDLARTPLTDDELENTVDMFRDAPRERAGWGLADQFGELLSRSPNTVQVQDIKALQTNLVASGYLPPDHPITGTWGASDYAGFRRFDRDNRDEQMAGHHWYSAPMESGMRAITNTLPSRVFQGIVGAAKGTVLQAPETATRVGALGGAAGGALIGTAIAPGVGTLAGAGIGAAVGFFSDLLTEQEGEDGQSVPESILDALSPFEEYSQSGPKAFWEDLGFVLTAASLASGGAAIARGVGTAAAGVSAAQSAAGPGSSWVRAALQPAAAAGKSELGVMGTLLRAAETKALGGTPGALTGFMEKFSPISFVNRLGPQVALKTFTGLSQAQMGARLFGGIGQGSSQKFTEAKVALEATLGRDLTEDELAEVAKKTGSTEIEKQIANAPQLKSGLEIPFLGDAVDLAAFALYPEKLLPFSGTRIASSTVSMLGDTQLAPFVHAVMHGDSALSVGQARAKVKELLDPVDNAWMRADYGINFEARQRIAKEFPGNTEEAFAQRALPKTRADVIREIGEEMDATGKSPLLENVMAYSHLQPDDFTAELIRQGSTNSGLDRLANWKKANQLSKAVEREVGENTRFLRDGEGNIIGAEAWIAGDDIVTPYMGGEFRRPGKEQVSVGGIKRTGSTTNMDILQIEGRIQKLEELAKKRERYAERGASVPMESYAARNEALAARQEIKGLEETLKDLKLNRGKEVIHDRFKIVPATKDFVTKQDFLTARKQFNDLRKSVLNAAGESEQIIARQNLVNFVDDLAAKGLITEKAAKTAKVEKPSKKVADELLHFSQGAATEVKLPTRLQKQFDDLGYKPVETGDDVLMPDQLSQMVEVTGIGDYTRRAAVWESLGLGLRKSPDKEIFQIRHQSELAEMRQVFEEGGIKLSPEQAMKRLHEKLESLNHEGAVLASIVKPKAGKARLYKVDTRDLSPEHILQAFEDVPGFTDKTARDVFGALRRGAAYGGELKLLHPLDSARAIGRAVRTNGLPGFSDVIRTWHAEDPFRMSRSAWRSEEFTYHPPTSADAALNLARSPQRARVETGLKKVAASSKVTEGQRQIGMALLDSLAVGQVKAKRFGTVDDFYRHLDVDYAEKYVEGSMDALFKRVKDAPSFEELKLYAQAYDDTKDWYERSSQALANLPLTGKTQLADGRMIDDTELFVNIMAATSPRIRVEGNVENAVRVFESIKRGDESWPGGILPASMGMLDDIISGKTIDKWGPARVAVERFPTENKAWYRYQNEVLESIPKAMTDRERGFGMEAAMDIGRELGLKGKNAASDYINEKIRHVRSILEDNRITPLAGEDLKLAKQYTAGLKKAPNKQIQMSQDLTTAVMNGEVEKARGILDKLETSLFGTKQVHTRPKVENFYHNLMGELEHVTNDSWMSKLFGYDGTLTTGQYDEITEKVKAVADDLGWKPAQVQAALWAAVREEDAAPLRVALHKALDAGDDVEAAKIREEIKSAVDMASMDQYLPKHVDILKDLNGDALLQKVSDDVLGATQFGPEYETVMRLFKNADFATLVHEDAHLLRRLLPEQDVRQLEKAYGVSSAPVYQSTGRTVDAAERIRVARRGKEILDRAANAPKQKLKNITASVMDDMHASVKEDWGGMSYDLRNGRAYDAPEGFVGGVVPNERTVTMPIADVEDRAKFSAAVLKARKKFRNELAREDHYLGIFRDPEKGTVTFEPSIIVKNKADAEAIATHLEADGGFFNFATKDLDVQDNAFPVQSEARLSGGWPRGAEEKFAEDAEKYLSWMLKKKRPNKDGLGDHQLDILRDALGGLWKNTRGVARERNTVPRSVRRILDEHFAEAIDLAPVRRVKAAAQATASKQVVGGAAVGAALGGWEGREDGILDKDMLKGALLGAGGGLVARKALKASYGYLPDYLARVNTALRYTLSFTFDAGRYVEQNTIAAAKYQLPPMISPTKYIKGREWKSPFREGATVRGEEAWNEAIKYWDEVNGTTYFQSIDDLDRRMYQAGLLGFSPRNWEAAQAFQLYQRGWGKDQIKDAIAQIGRYGTGRSAAEKSANFIVFPFSFSKKYLQTLGDFIMQTPGRNLLLHEGMRRYYESEADENLNDFLDKHLPILQELSMVNNLAFGISPGRFFLQGLSDHRTNVGKASQLLASFFVPSGAATPLAEAFGNAGDYAVNAFNPVVITGESINRAGGIDGFEDIFRRYIPFVRELDQYFTGPNAAVSRQIRALTEGADPYYQFSRYQDGLREIKGQYGPMATAMGYTSVDGLLASDAGAALGPAIDEQEEVLRQENPSGWSMSQEFQNQDAINAAGLIDLANKSDRSAGEDAILKLVEDVNRMSNLGSMLGMDSTVIGQMTAGRLRQTAASWAGDPRFAELWDRFFLREYGPITRVA